MTETAVTVRPQEPELTPFEVIERVVTSGDLASMKPQDRVAFYWRTCESLGLNPLTRPFEFHNLGGKIVMYAKKDATDQLRRLHGVTVTQVRRERDEDLGLLTVYARGRGRDGREDEATGVVSVKGLSGEALANAVMKAETKAKRRLTLSLVGLGFLDESEIEGLGERVDVDPTTGVIAERAKPRTLLESVNAQRARMAEAQDDAEVVEGEISEAAETAASQPAAGPAAASAGGADVDSGEGSSEAPGASEAGAAGEAPGWLAGAGEQQGDAPPFVAAIREAAEDPEAPKGAATKALTAQLGEVFRAAGLGWDAVARGVAVLWPDADPSKPTAAQARAIVLAAGAPDFGEQWRSLSAGKD